MSPAKVHVVGAGLAGLAAAVSLAGKGVQVELSEAAGQAGGRCRSYFEPSLGLVIDNGNHLVLSGNGAVQAYLAAIGSGDRLAGPPSAVFPFVDVATGERWAVKPNHGRLPWWIFVHGRRAPGSTALDHLALAALLKASDADRTVADECRCAGALWERFARPVLLAALNTEPEQASATLAGAVLQETLAKGGAACRPLFAESGLSATFVDPALKRLERHGSAIHYNRRLRRLVVSDGEDRRSVIGLDFGASMVSVAPGDAVVLAVPSWVAEELVPGIDAPGTFRAILNGHFKVAPPGAPAMIGVVGGTVEWIFAFRDRLSVTVSSADRFLDTDRRELAALLWRDVAAVHGLPAALPAWQIVMEKRATFAATPQEAARRPDAATAWDNLFLAGDWTNTGLPATIEGALRSGYRAAESAFDHGLVDEA